MGIAPGPQDVANRKARYNFYRFFGEPALADSFKNIIVNHLAAEAGGPVAIAELRRRINPTREEAAAFDQAIDELIRQGRVIPGDSGAAIELPSRQDEFAGIFHSTTRGFGFVTPLKLDGRDDIFIPAQDTAGSLNGDVVLVRLVAAGKRDDRGRSTAGRVVDILRRASNRSVGTLAQELNAWVVIPDGNVHKAPIVVHDPGAKSAAIGDKVVVELLRFAAPGKPAEGVIIEVLGPRGEPEVELASIIHQFELPGEFPPEALEQARQAALQFEPAAAGQREDLTGELIVTIDPDDARDFDDAISLRPLLDDSDSAADVEELLGPELSQRPGPAAWELGVHIADVAHFVPVESPLDMEARRRGNSIYFPRQVIPMLPELLSNGVCSLQQDQPRLTKSAFIRYDRHGRVVGARFANTVIRSARRLTYRDAQALIDDARGHGRPYSKGLLDSPPNPNVPKVPGPVRDLLVNMDKLARVIQRRRLAQGMIVLDLPEVELIMDPDGRVIDARPEDDSFTHKIIEMFMVEANEAVARFLTDKGLSVLRRIHPEPDMEVSDQVRRFMAASGKKTPRTLDRRMIQELLDSVRGTPVAYAVHLSVLKTFTTAEYSPEAMGHYALASDNYAHFTSPIRRYADLVIHRCLDSLIAQEHGPAGAGGARRKKPARTRPPQCDNVAPSAMETCLLMPQTLGNVPDHITLQKLSRHLSFTERRAQNAERELRQVKVLELLSQHIGDTVDGVITGVNNFGVFVQSSRFLVEGMVRVSDLPPDYWMFDDRTGCLRGQRTGRKIALGDPVRVQIMAINVPTRRMDLLLLEHGSVRGGKPALKPVMPRRDPKSLAASKVSREKWRPGGELQPRSRRGGQSGKGERTRRGHADQRGPRGRQGRQGRQRRGR